MQNSSSRQKCHHIATSAVSNFGFYILQPFHNKPMFYYFFCIPTYTCCVRRYTELSCISTTHSVTTSDTALLPQLCPNFCFYVLPLLYIYLHVSFHSLGFHFAVICRNTRKAGVSVLYLAILFQFSRTSCELPHVRHVQADVTPHFYLSSVQPLSLTSCYLFSISLHLRFT